MLLSAIICTHDRHDLCRKAVESLLHQDAASIEIIVVDNSTSADAAARFARSFEGAPITFLHTTDIGLSNARNIGARQAAGSIVAYLDDDAIAAPTWAAALAEAFDASDGRAGVVGGRVRPIWQVPRPGWMTQRGLDALSVIDLGAERRILRPAEWLAGCNIAFARDALLAVGGFDTSLGRVGGALLSNEETIVCNRIRDLGREIIYAPEAIVDHVIPAARTTADYIARRVAWQAVSDALAFPKVARERAAAVRARAGLLDRAVTAMRLFRLLGRRNSAITDKECDLVYDVVNSLLSHESV